jgi:hypothetical protein
MGQDSPNLVTLAAEQSAFYSCFAHILLLLLLSFRLRLYSRTLLSLHEQGCQIFIGTTYQNRENVPNDRQNIPNGNKIPNGRKMYHRAANLSILSTSGSSKIFTNWDFWYAIVPSGNPVQEHGKNGQISFFHSSLSTFAKK